MAHDLALFVEAMPAPLQRFSSQFIEPGISISPLFQPVYHTEYKINLPY
jgi:hypothetical protein